MRFLLKSARLRKLIANWLIKWMGHLVYYEPATQAAPSLAAWLKKQKKISPSQLRRLTLAVLMHWYDFASHQERDFTTAPKTHEDFRLAFPYNLIFMLYNSLSNGKVIQTAVEFEEQMGGFPPIQINPVDHLINYVTSSNQSLRIELIANQGSYEFGAPINVSLTLQNVTDTTITLNNKQGPTIKFIAKSFLKDVKTLVDWSPEDTSEEGHQIILSPGIPVTVKWVTDLPEKSGYWITAQIYVPNYETKIDLTIDLYYGIEPILTPISTKSFCTL